MTERRLLVLGGTSGIGKAVFTRLALRESVWSYCFAPSPDEVDVVDGTAMLPWFERNRPTDVVYSVGINKLDWTRDIRFGDFADVMNANVWGFINTIKALDRSGVKANVVAVTSDAAWRPMRTSAVYCASKAALEMAVRVAAREYAPAGWRVNAVAPGKVDDTPMTEYVDQRVLELRGWTVEAAEEYELRSTPLGRKVTKDEVAEVIRQVLFGPQAQTGEIIAVNGGR